MTDTVKTLIQLTKAQGITQAELSEKIGVTRGAVWLWFNDGRTPSINYVEKWADAIGYKVVIVRKK